MEAVAPFPTLGTGCMFSCAWHQLHVFPRLAPIARFPTLGNDCRFSRACYQLHVFPRLVPIARFPTLGNDCRFSRAWYRLQGFPRLAPVACFPALGTDCKVSRAWHLLQVSCVLDWSIDNLHRLLDCVISIHLYVFPCLSSLQVLDCSAHLYIFRLATLTCFCTYFYTHPMI